MDRSIDGKGSPGVRCQASPDTLPSEQMGPCGMWARWRHFTRDMGCTDGASITGSRSRGRPWALPWLLMAPHGIGTGSVRSTKGRETTGGTCRVSPRIWRLGRTVPCGILGLTSAGKQAMAFTDGIKGPGSKWRARGLESQSDLTEFPGAGQLMETSIKPYYDDAKHLRA